MTHTPRTSQGSRKAEVGEMEQNNNATQGANWRFTFRPDAEPRFTWRHPLDVQAGDVDCTDMGDDAFEAFLETVQDCRDPIADEKARDIAQGYRDAAEARGDEHSRLAP